jgi:hypothetical protein
LREKSGVPTERVSRADFEQSLLRQLGVADYLDSMPEVRPRDEIRAPKSQALEQLAAALPRVLDSTPEWDCDDYAMRAATYATEEGVSFGVVSNHDASPPHAYNCAITQSHDVYWIEPQTGELFLAGDGGSGIVENYDPAPTDSCFIWL